MSPLPMLNFYMFYISIKPQNICVTKKILHFHFFSCVSFRITRLWLSGAIRISTYNKAIKIMAWLLCIWCWGNEKTVYLIVSIHLYKLTAGEYTSVWISVSSLDFVTSVTKNVYGISWNSEDIPSHIDCKSSTNSRKCEVALHLGFFILLTVNYMSYQQT